MRFIFVCGIHSCGKTTLLQYLKQNAHVSFKGTEIGKDLFYQRKLHPEDQDVAFELEIARRELERDNTIMGKNGVVAVESWHPGNLAYAHVRNPSCVNNLIDLTINSPLLPFAHGIWLRMPPAEIKKRSKTFKNDTEWAIKFYKKIDQNIERSLKSLNLYDRTIVINALQPTSKIIKSTLCYMENQVKADKA